MIFGAVFEERTVTWNEVLTERRPSLTETVTGYWAKACSTVGVQEATPSVGFTVIPFGPSTKAKVRFCAGRSASLADRRITVGFIGSMVRLSTDANSGAWLTSKATTVKEVVVLSTGTPLSVTRTTTVLVLGPWASVGRNDT